MGVTERTHPVSVSDGLVDFVRSDTGHGIFWGTFTLEMGIHPSTYDCSLGRHDMTTCATVGQTAFYSNKFYLEGPEGNFGRS